MLRVNEVESLSSMVDNRRSSRAVLQSKFSS